MVLRNAFEDMATEDTLAALVNVLENLARTWPLARDSSDRLRISPLASDTALGTSTYWANFGTYPTYYATGGPTSVDAREQLAAIANANFMATRNQRWSL